MIKIENIKTIAIPNPNDLYQINELMVRQSICLFYGADGKGKSYVITSLLANALCNGNVLGREAKINRILYVSGEGNVFLPLRLKALQENYGDISGFDVLRDFDGDINLYSYGAMDRFIDVVREINEFNDPYDVIVFDTLNSMSEGAKESSADDTAKLKACMKLVCTKLDCSIFIVHHSGKTDDNEGGQAKDVRGSSAITAMCDLIIRIHDNQLICRKVRNGKVFSPVPYKIETVGNSAIARFMTDNATDNPPIGSIDFCVKSLVDNPELSNIQLTRLVFNPNAQRTTSKQAEIISQARLKYANIYEQKKIVEIDTVDDVVDIADFISPNELDNDDYDEFSFLPDADAMGDSLPNVIVATSTRDLLRQLGGITQ
jgi:hypothetical protein